jgi:hypothetical protein
MCAGLRVGWCENAARVVGRTIIENSRIVAGTNRGTLHVNFARARPGYIQLFYSRLFCAALDVTSILDFCQPAVGCFLASRRVWIVHVHARFRTKMHADKTIYTVEPFDTSF